MEMRKQPVQKRSSEMVAALLEAAEREIGERGLANTTTNHIARRAGASVGSLYQYFASKEAIIDALLQRQVSRITAVVQGQLRVLIDQDLATVTRTILARVYDLVEQDKGQRELVRNWHLLHTDALFKALEQHMMEACRLYLLRHLEQYPIDNLPATLFVLINAVHYSSVRYLSMEAPVLTRDEVIESLTHMVVAMCTVRATA